MTVMKATSVVRQNQNLSQQENRNQEMAVAVGMKIIMSGNNIEKEFGNIVRLRRCECPCGKKWSALICGELCGECASKGGCY